MLKIRKEQMGAFSAALTREANRRLAAYARQRFPRGFKQADDAALYEFAGKVRITAKQYGIDKENDVATFLDFTVMYGEEFPTSSWAADVLQNDALLGPSKITILRQRVRATGVNL